MKVQVMHLAIAIVSRALPLPRSLSGVPTPSLPLVPLALIGVSFLFLKHIQGIVIAGVIALVALAAAQIRPSCSMPQLFESRIIAFDPNDRVYHNHSSDYRIFGRYSYDGIYQRRRIFVRPLRFHG